MLLLRFYLFQPEEYQEPCNKVVSPAEHLAGFEPGAFQFSSQHLNPQQQWIKTIALSQLFKVC